MKNYTAKAPVHLALLALVLLFMSYIAPSQALSLETEGVLEGPPYYTGGYDVGLGDDDWYYDYYEPYETGDYGLYDGWYDSDWYNYDYYSGYYDTDYSNDWFYDSYDDPGDAGLFDI